MSGGAPLHEFGGWRFDAGTGDLCDGETTTRLEPQVARLLAYFLTHQDTLISRDELMVAVWDNRIVSDHAVNRCLSILRNQLSPDDRNAYIETVVRRGFISHFPPPVTAPPDRPVDDRADDGAHATRTSHRVRPWMPVALVGVAALVLVGALRMFGEPSPPAAGAGSGGAPMVAVLPFASAGLAADSDFFARGMHEDLLAQLAQLQSVRVISRTSVSEYRDSQRNIREIGRELGADAILEGGVQRIGDQIRINVQLIDARTDADLWAQQYDRELTAANIFDIQGEIARSIASSLQSTLTRQDAAQLDVLPTDNMAAYRAYHEAMQLRYTETIAVPGYVGRLERAVALDPDFLRARAELAGSLSYISFLQPDPESIRRLEDQLERIRALAPESAEYLIAQSYYTYYILKDHDRAFELISRAQNLRPSDPQLLELQSWIQRRQGDIDGMIGTVRQGRKLDPRNPLWTARLVFNLALVHRYDEAFAEFESTDLDNFRLAALGSTLRVREHREPGRLLQDLAGLQKEYGVQAEPFALWEAHIAARDFDGAAAVLDSVQAATRPSDMWTSLGIPDAGLARILTDHFLDVPTLSGPAMEDSRSQLAADRTPAIVGFKPNAHLAAAYVAAVAGDRAETERRVRTWFRQAARDLAERVMQRHHACRALGIAAAASAVVECLRSGLSEPSQAMPFIEPFLPYYDSIRDDPRFVGFVATLTRSTAGAPAPRD